MFTAFALIISLLQPAPKQAELELKITPPDAAVQVNGKATKDMTVKLSAGKHTIEVSRAGFETRKRTVVLKAGQKQKLSIALKKSGRSGGLAPKPKPDGGKVTPAPKPRPDGGRVRPAPKRADKQVRPVPKRDEAKPTPTPRPTPRPTPVRKDEEKRADVKPAPIRRKEAKSGGDARVRPKEKTADTRIRRKDDSGSRRGTGGGTQAVTDDRGGGSGSYKPFAIASFVVGGLAVTGGVIVGMMANDSADKFNSSTDRGEKLKLRDDTQALALGSNVLYGVGATGVLLGALLLAIDPGDGPRATAGALPEGGAFIGFGGTW